MLYKKTYLQKWFDLTPQTFRSEVDLKVTMVECTDSLLNATVFVFCVKGRTCMLD